MNWPGVAQAAVTLSFDDGYLATCECTMGLLQACGWGATYNVITDYVGTVFEGLPTADWSTWREASQMGHEIASHGARHIAMAGLWSDVCRLWKGLYTVPNRRAYLGQLMATARALHSWHSSKASARDQTSVPLLDSLMASRLCIAQHIQGQPVESLAYPAGRHNAASRWAAARAGFRSARTADPGLNDSNVNLFALRAIVLGPGNSPAQLRDWLQLACSRRAWLIIVLHLVAERNTTGYPYFCSLAAFQQLLDMLQKLPLWVAPQGQVVRYLQVQCSSGSLA